MFTVGADGGVTRGVRDDSVGVSSVGSPVSPRLACLYVMLAALAMCYATVGCRISQNAYVARLALGGDPSILDRSFRFLFPYLLYTLL